MAKRKTSAEKRAGKETGRNADSPVEVPARGWRDVLARAIIRSWRNNIAHAAAGTAFYGLLSIVPITIVCVIAYSFLADPSDIIRAVRRLEAIMPEAAAIEIGRQFERIVDASARARGFGIVGALAVALFGARNAATALIAALNIAYGEKEQRTFSKLTSVALTIMASAFVLAFAILFLMSIIGAIGAFLPDASDFGGRVLQVIGVLAIATLGAVGAAALYRFAPCRTKPKWRWLAAGSLVAAGMWLAVTAVFGFYVSRIASFATIYGPSAAPIVLLIWLYLSALAFLFGAELNAELERQTEKDTTDGADKPRGQRGAKAADAVASG